MREKCVSPRDARGRVARGPQCDARQPEGLRRSELAAKHPRPKPRTYAKTGSVRYSPERTHITYKQPLLHFSYGFHTAYIS